MADLLMPQDDRRSSRRYQGWQSVLLSDSFESDVIALAGGGMFNSPMCSIETGQLKITRKSIVCDHDVVTDSISSRVIVSDLISWRDLSPHDNITDSSDAIIFGNLALDGPNAFLARNSNV
jgi:hypothetical protein